MKKMVYFFALLVVTFFSSCKDTNAPEVVTLEDGIYLGVFGDYSGAAYEVKNSQVIPLGNTMEVVKFTVIDNQSFTAAYNAAFYVPFICAKSKLTKNDYQQAVAGDKNKEFFGLHFLYNNKEASYNNGLFMAVREASQPGFYNITLVGINGRYEKTTATMTTEDGHQKMSFTVSPVISNNYDNKNEIWNITFSPITGYKFGTNVLFISKESGLWPENFMCAAVTIHNE
jgi:hypothetical protein